MSPKLLFSLVVSILLVQCKSLSGKKTSQGVAENNAARSTHSLPPIPPSSYPINPENTFTPPPAPSVPQAAKKTPTEEPITTPNTERIHAPQTPPTTQTQKTDEPTKKENLSTANCPKKIPSASHKGEIYCDIFPEGCLYVPQTISNRPLFYIRGLIQGSPSKPPASTKALFSSDYDLSSVAESNQQILLATHTSTTKISSETLACLKSWSNDNEIDVASHSAGYKGLAASSETLRNNVRLLVLLDSFYNRDSVTNSIRNIKPKSCIGYYTDHYNKAKESIVNLAQSVERDTSCDLDQARGHISNVSPFLRNNLSSNPAIVNNSTVDQNTVKHKATGI